MMDAIQAFTESRSHSGDYPCNLIQTEQFLYELEQYKATLYNPDGGYFSPRRKDIRFWSLYDSAAGYQPKDGVKATEDDLSRLRVLSETAPDPISTFTFIYSRTSRSALSCSREQLMQILTHYQVMTPFLDFVFSFRVREEPETLAGFRCEDRLHKSNSRFAHANLQRSGLQIQHAFNLIAVEFDKHQEEWPWPLRQTATHHCFDPISGQASWISLKSNDEVSKRLRQSIPVHPKLQPSALVTPEARFTATLLTHLIIFHWCVENWPKYIDYLEGKVKEQLVKVGFVPVTALTVPEKIEKYAALRRSTMNSYKGPPPPSRNGTLQKTHSFQAPTQLVKRLSEKVSERFFPENKLQQSPEPQTPTKKDIDLDFDQLFNFDELQNLGQLGDEMRQSLLVIGQNINVMNQIMARYTALMTSQDFKAHIKVQDCEADMDSFLSRARQLVRLLENHALRLESIIASLESAKNQFHGILQYRNIRTGEYFAQSAHDSAKVMERMAIKTKQETVSMHSITILTLIFLPGTFLATVFGSGVLNWDENGDGWATRMPGLRLFLAICLPMTSVTLGVWLVWNWHSKKKQKEDFWRLAEEGGALAAATAAVIATTGETAAKGPS